MTIRIFAVGKKHEAWVEAGISRYEKRLRKPFKIEWQFLSHSSLQGDEARDQESARILSAIKKGFVILFDERGSQVGSRTFSKKLMTAFQQGLDVTFIIGGAYGVNDDVRQRADSVLSLSSMVFPHQLVRLISVEQIYRAQEIAGGRSYHHD